jgi:hypothetical protein
MLAKRLTRQGPTVSGGTLAAVLAQKAASAAVPPSVVSSSIKAGALFAVGQTAAPGVLSVKAVALAEGVLKTMLLSKLKIATAVLAAVAFLVAGAAALPPHAPGAGPSAQAVPPKHERDFPQRPDERKELPGISVIGVVKAWAAETNTLTVADGKSTFTLPVTNDVAVVIDGKPGKLSALLVGMSVELRLAGTAEKPRVVSIQAEGPQVFGIVKAVNAERNIIMFFPDDRGPKNHFNVATDAAIEIDGRRGMLAALPTGAHVTLARFVAHRTAGQVQATGPQVVGFVRAVDPQQYTITVTDTQWNRHVRKPLPIDKGGENTFRVPRGITLRIDGTPRELAALPTGTRVRLDLRADQKTARGVKVEGPTVSGFVKAVEAEKHAITLSDTVWKPGSGQDLPADGGVNTFAVAGDATIDIDSKPGDLKRLPTGAFVHAVALSVDQKTARGIRAAGPSVAGVVKAVDAEHNTITLADTLWKPGTGHNLPADGKEATFGVADDANIEIDLKRGKLGGVRPGLRVFLGLCVDRRTARSITVAGPGVSGFLKAVDADQKTITLSDTVWKPGSGQDLPADGGVNTFAVAGDAAIDIDGCPGKLAALPTGVRVFLSLCVDRNTARGINAGGPVLKGSIKAVDGEKSTITITETLWDHATGKSLPADGGEHTFTVARDARIDTDGEAGTLAGLAAGMQVDLVLRVNRRTVTTIQAKTP